MIADAMEGKPFGDQVFTEVSGGLKAIGAEDALITTFEDFWPRLKRGVGPMNHLYILALQQYVRSNPEDQLRIFSFLESSASYSDPNQIQRAFESATAMGNRTAALLKILDCLRSIVHNDPDVDLFYASVHGDTALKESALNRGADTSMTDARLVSKYRSQLAAQCPDALAEFERG